jgi:hypothetical protein
MIANQQHAGFRTVVSRMPGIHVRSFARVDREAERIPQASRDLGQPFVPKIVATQYVTQLSIVNDTKRKVTIIVDFGIFALQALEWPSEYFTCDSLHLFQSTKDSRIVPPVSGFSDCRVSANLPGANLAAKSCRVKKDSGRYRRKRRISDEFRPPRRHRLRR